ncbi:MAG: hypothetical protein RJB66_2634 [Pseudomonadota bacterium]|jgi:flagellar motor protein MotB
MGMSKKKSSHNSNHAPHVDEKWLVSYSDLMTLLFGFFVLMYSLAAENPNGAQALAEIADAMNDKAKKEAPPVMVKITDKELKELRDTVSKQKEEITQLENKIAELEKLLEEQKLQITDLASKTETQSREIAATQAFEDPAPLKKKIEELEKQLKKKLADEAKLAKRLEELKSNNFLIVFTKWDTEKHDIDLTVKTPSGKLYDFKNRKYPDTAGELVLDSRYGPGAEIWSTNKLAPGDYEVTVTLYNQTGNLTDAVVETGLVSSLSNIKMPTIKLNKTGQQKTHYQFNVDDEGRIKMKDETSIKKE